MAAPKPGRALCTCNHRERNHTESGCSRCWTCKGFTRRKSGGPSRRSVWYLPTAFESSRRRH
jgi:hypothetical protein